MRPVIIGICDAVVDIYGESLGHLPAAEVTKKVKLLTANDKRLTNEVMLELFAIIKEKKKK